MKFLSNSNSLLLAAAFVSLQACSDICEVQNPLSGDLLKSLSATVTDFELGEDEATRTSYVVSPTEGFVFSWALGDTLGIYPVGGNQVDFPISDGIGTKTALFDGGSWALRSSYTYAGYYPYSANHYHNPQTAIPVTFAGQKQSGNNKLEGLSKYDYMAAAPVGASLSGSVNLELKHLASFVRFQLTMPSVGNYTSMTLTSGDVKFIETATYDLTSESPALTPVGLSETFTLALEDITTTEANQVITLYAMIAPVSQKTSSITIQVADDKKNIYSIETTGKNLTAGKSYNYSLTLESDRTTGGTGEDAGWDGDEDIFNGHDYVDLGIRDAEGHPIYWATCNIGAEKPADYGDYYAWGEVETKDSYDESNYVHRKYFDEIPGEEDENGFISDGSPAGYQYINIGKDIAGTQYDVAHVKWSGNWRMPSSDEQKALLDNCSWTWTKMRNSNGDIVEGYKVSNKADESKFIFLPAAGYRYDSGLNDAGSFGYYWSSSLDTWSSDYAYCLSFLSDYVYRSNSSRYYGQSVRAVCTPNFETKSHNGHEYVDLGLKDSEGNTIYWARCNVGAETPEEYGLYFAWGETEGYTRDSNDGHSFDWANYKWFNGSSDTMTKYCIDSSYGNVDNKTVLDPEDDAATQNWGGNWRMPTEAEQEQLIYSCTWTWNSTKNGYTVTGPNGNSIFLPAAGCREDSYHYNALSTGYYWSSSLRTSGSYFAYCLNFDSRYVDWDRGYGRCGGRSVRAVCVSIE